MARNVSTIKESIRVKKNTYQELQNILFKEEGGDDLGIFNLFADTIALNINIFEQLLDDYNSAIDDTIDNGVPGTEAYIYKKVLEFQYDATTPQVVELGEDLVPRYPVVDESIRIITRAAVLTLGNGRVTIKAAKSDPPTPLSSTEKIALKDYLEVISPAGPVITVQSDNSDKLYVSASVYYDGQYVDSIQSDVESAINAYLSQLDFNGKVLNSKIQDAIQGVAGVKDVVINEVKARKDSTPFAGATVVARQWPTIAGYIVEETTSGQKFADTITYTAE
jgi:Baseplate J-like protein